MRSALFKLHVNYLPVRANILPGRFKIDPKGTAVAGRDNAEALTYGYYLLHMFEGWCVCCSS